MGQVKGTCLAALGAEHPNTLRCMENLAHTYFKRGRRKEAEGPLVHVKETRIRVLGAAHPDALWSMERLAILYLDTDRQKEAEELLVRVKETLDHPCTLSSTENLAGTYNRRRSKEAEGLYIQVSGCLG